MTQKLSWTQKLMGSWFNLPHGTKQKIKKKFKIKNQQATKKKIQKKSIH